MMPSTSQGWSECNLSQVYYKIDKTYLWIKLKKRTKHYESFSTNTHQKTKRATKENVTESWSIRMVYTYRKYCYINSLHIVHSRSESLYRRQWYLADKYPPDPSVIPAEFCEHLTIFGRSSTITRTATFQQQKDILNILFLTGILENIHSDYHGCWSGTHAIGVPKV